MKTVWLTLFIATAATCHAVLTDPPSVMSIPPLSAAPTVDGRVETREWIEAARLPGLSRLPGGASDGRDTQIYVGWYKDSLYFGVICRRSPQATADVTGQESQPDQQADHLELTVSPAKGTPTTFRLRGRPTGAGWEAELPIPFSGLGGRGEYKLTAVLREPSLGLASPPLTQQIKIGDVPVAARFTEAGEFTGGKWQGAELELICAGRQDLPAAVTLVLKRAAEQVQRVETNQLMLRSDSSARWRVVGPLMAGRYSVEYHVQASGVSIARGAFGFVAGGPMRVELRPYFLWRKGVFVKVEMLGYKATEVELRLQDSTGRKTYQTARFWTGDDGRGEGFINTQGVPAGPLLVRVEAYAGGQLTASQAVALLGN